jgi:hypothetical protein
MRELRQRREPPEHGTESAYRNHGCRCPKCCDVGVTLNRVLTEKILAGEVSVSHGTGAAYGTLKCRCDECCAYAHALAVSAWASGGEAIRQRNAASVAAAAKHGQEWTGPELETVATRDDLSVKELAAMLGRSLAAVRSMRHKVRHDPIKKRIAGAPLRGVE